MPRPDQRLALAQIELTLRTQARATVVMPCGTGKTLVQLWAAQQQGARTVLVLVPSLALLSQTLDVWSRNTAWGERFEYLCVCSDPSVSAEQDAIIIRATDVPFHVDTRIRPPRVSLLVPRPLLATRCAWCFPPISRRAWWRPTSNGLDSLSILGIFDEAHKTTGPKDGLFALACGRFSPSGPPKRLFFTATPFGTSTFDTEIRMATLRLVSMDDAARLRSACL